MKTASQFPRRITNNLIISFLFCLALPFLSGCGGGLPKLSPAEQAEVDKYIADDGTESLIKYLESVNASSDKERVRKYVLHFVKRGADINARGGGGVTPLCIACVHEDIEVIKILISKGADVNAKFFFIGGDFTPLHVVAWKGNVEIVKLLVSKGADVKAKTSDGLTPLHLAVATGIWVGPTGMSRDGNESDDVEIAKLLISRGADVNAVASVRTHSLPGQPSGREMTPLDFAKDEFFGPPSKAVVDYLSNVSSQGGKNSTKAGNTATKEAMPGADRGSCTNNLKQIGFALHSYHDTYRVFPPLYSVDKTGKPLHSWRVLILPFVEQKALYEQIRLDEPWNSKHNSQFHSRVLNLYQCPENKDIKGTTNCIYSVIKDDEHCFPESGKSIHLGNISDGSSNTVAVVEVKKPFCWMDPTADLTLAEFSKGINKGRAGSYHTGGCNVLVFDGSAHFLPDSTDTKTLRALATKNGGESVSLP